MKKLSSRLAIVLFLFLCSCVTFNEFPIEVYQPSKVDFTADIKNVTLVSRNLKYASDTLTNYYFKDFKRTKDILPINHDSLSVKACFDSLSVKIKNSKRFEKVTVLPYSSLPVQHVKDILPPSKKLIQQISSNTKDDALILLDLYSSFYSVYTNKDNGRLIAKVITATIWTVYDASKIQILKHTSLVDTLYWDGLDESGNYLASRIPNKKAALQIASALAGVKYSKYIVPSWAKVNRQTMTFRQEDFINATELAKKNKWEEASALWEKYTQSPNKRCRIVSLYNLAVASEMNGDMDAAIELISNASKVSSSAAYKKENETIRKYAAILAKRKLELKTINSMNDGI